jgi:hypothetical protein
VVLLRGEGSIPLGVLLNSSMSMTLSAKPAPGVKVGSGIKKFIDKTGKYGVERKIEHNESSESV